MDLMYHLGVLCIGLAVLIVGSLAVCAITWLLMSGNTITWSVVITLVVIVTAYGIGSIIVQDLDLTL